MELSEDAVKQRLSRGRKMLHEEVISFVEGTLRPGRRPGQAFSGAVLAALPLTTASAAASTASAAAAKSGVLAWLAPFLGIFSGMFAHWLVVRAAPTEAERRAQKIAFTSLWVFVLIWAVPGQVGMGALRQHLQWSDRTYYGAMAGYWWLYAVIAVTMTILMMRRFILLRRQSESTGDIQRPGMVPLKPAGNAVVLGCTTLAFFSWLIPLAWRTHDTGGVAIITALMLGLGVWQIVSLQGKTGVPAMRAIAVHLALAWAAVLMVLNLRLDVWLAYMHGSSVGEIHSLLPVWVAPLLTLALVLWAGLMMILTKPVPPYLVSVPVLSKRTWLAADQ